MSLTLPPPRRMGGKCWYATIDVDEADRPQLDEWLADDRITATRIAAALQAYGVTGSQVANHRREHRPPNDPCL